MYFLGEILVCAFWITVVGVSYYLDEKKQITQLDLKNQFTVWPIGTETDHHTHQNKGRYVQCNFLL